MRVFKGVARCPITSLDVSDNRPLVSVTQTKRKCMRSLRGNQKRILVFTLIALVGASVVGAVVLSAKRKTQAPQLPRQTMAELEEKEKHHTLSLKETAELTKARGKNRAILAGVPVLYPGAEDPEELDQILSRYTIIVGEMITERIYVGEHERISSWCRFRVVDMITQAPPHSFASRTIPTDLLPIAENEFIIPREGGSVTIDGVEIVQHELAVIEFQRSQKYLLLLSLDPATKIAELALGPQSVLPIKGDGTLDLRQQEHILQRALALHHRASIGQLKADLNK